MTETMGPAMAFGIGALLMLIGVKFWVVFTLSAIAAIGEADLGRAGAIGVFILLVVLAESVHLALLGVTRVVPDRSAAVLDRTESWLRAHNRVIVIVIGLLVGTWFLNTALDGLGVW